MPQKRSSCTPPTGYLTGGTGGSGGGGGSAGGGGKGATGGIGGTVTVGGGGTGRLTGSGGGGGAATTATGAGGAETGLEGESEAGSVPEEEPVGRAVGLPPSAVTACFSFRCRTTTVTCRGFFVCGAAAPDVVAADFGATTAAAVRPCGAITFFTPA